MIRDLTQSLTQWLGAGGERIGQIAVGRVADGFELRHVDDLGRDDLRRFTRTEDARSLANLNPAGTYRPLKTAPNLQRGWRLVLPNAAALRLALDYFYPAMSGVWFSYVRGALPAVPLRTTLARQSGMYRIAQKIADGQARTLIDSFCRGCLKCRLWDGQTAVDDPKAMPLLCQEACNLLVAEARKVVKSQPGS